MAFTAANIATLEAAYLEVLSRGAAEVEINGRRTKYTDPAKLREAIEYVSAQVSSDTHGASVPVKFISVSG